MTDLCPCHGWEPEVCPGLDEPAPKADAWHEWDEWDGHFDLRPITTVDTGGLL